MPKTELQSMYLGRPHLNNARQKSNTGSQGFSDFRFQDSILICTLQITVPMVIQTCHRNWSLPPQQETQLKRILQARVSPKTRCRALWWDGAPYTLWIVEFTSIDSDELITTHLEFTTLVLLLFKATAGWNCL